MKDVFDKLFVRSTDYVATVDVEDSDVLSDLYQSSKGLVCVGKVSDKNFEGLGTVKMLKGVKQLDSSIFNKILAVYNDELNIKGIVSAAENLGLVLLCNVPEEKQELFAALLEQKAGIVDVWSLESDKKGTVDILFKVHKY